MHCGSACMQVLAAGSHLDMYENTTPHHLHRNIVLTLGIKGEKEEEKQLIQPKDLYPRC